MITFFFYRCTSLILTKPLKEKLDENYTRRMLYALLNKSWKQHPIKQELYGYLPLITQTIHVRRARHVAFIWEN